MRVKICGITRLEDAGEAVAAGAWAIGLNHHPESPRFVESALAAEISAAVRRQVHVAGVFVNAGLDRVVRAVEDEALDMVQLHGDEGPAFCREVARRSGARVIKAFGVRSAADIQAAEAFRTDFHLLDAHHPRLRGGTGASFDWEIAATHAGSIPVILAGGLDPENVGEAIAAVGPSAVDVASGVESAPGRKSPSLMRDFVEAARAAHEAGVGS